ncbi:P-aminobenzoate N-oxygenase AurF [Stigmatella aurantiaca]|uniref:p-aminobenzoate N-oxygenase AurF n=1 Tax=Stigmatella aurantiaca TaxID=41 RepID=A0A1H8F9V7_STIAU|nr:diiron oxygenase [Stigmatella aurantiaca]SEN28356.1 P-aminobenzoate N-oxygenase AurF [Stigmatella aurantiaca]
MPQTDSRVHLKDYKTKELQWDKFATARSIPRRMLPEGPLTGQMCPTARQPLYHHPLMQAVGQQAQDHLLIHTTYKYMSDISHVEMDTVNQISLKIVNNTLPFSFSEDIQHDALAIIVDESYHAYVARDFMRQVIERSGVKPVTMPVKTVLSEAIAHGKSVLPENLHEVFELVGVCVGENTLTKELLHLTGDRSMNPVVHQVIEDHVRDESRHAVFFTHILKLMWSALDEPSRSAIGPLLPEFILNYFKPDPQYERDVLRSLQVPEHHIDRILGETFAPMPLEELWPRIPIIGHVMGVLKQSGVLENGKTADAFRRIKLLN